MMDRINNFLVVRVFCLCLTLVPLFASSCMSLQYRMGEDFNIDPGPYPGLRITAEIIEQSFQDAETAGMIYGLWFYWVPDIPISFCLDTLCLPYDLLHSSDESALSGNPISPETQ